MDPFDSGGRRKVGDRAGDGNDDDEEEEEEFQPMDKGEQESSATAVEAGDVIGQTPSQQHAALDASQQTRTVIIQSQSQSQSQSQLYDNESNVTNISNTAISTTDDSRIGSDKIESTSKLYGSTKKRKDGKSPLLLDDPNRKMRAVPPKASASASASIQSQGKKKRRNSTASLDSAASAGHQSNLLLKDEVAKACIEYEMLLQAKGDVSHIRHQSAFLSSPFNLFFQFHRRRHRRETEAFTTLQSPKSTTTTTSSSITSSTTDIRTTFSYTMKDVFDFIYTDPTTKGQSQSQSQHDNTTFISARQVERDWKVLNVSQKALFYAAHNVEKEKRKQKSQSTSSSTSTSINQYEQQSQRQDISESRKPTASSHKKEQLPQQGLEWQHQQRQRQQQQEQQEHSIDDENLFRQRKESTGTSREHQHEQQRHDELLHRTELQEEQYHHRFNLFQVKQQQYQQQQLMLMQQRQQIQRQQQHLRRLEQQHQQQQQQQQRKGNVDEDHDDIDYRTGSIHPMVPLSRNPDMLPIHRSASALPMSHAKYPPMYADLHRSSLDNRMLSNPSQHQHQQQYQQHQRNLMSRTNYGPSRSVASASALYQDSVDDNDTIVTEDATITTAATAALSSVPIATATILEEYRRLRWEEEQDRQQYMQDLLQLQQMEYDDTTTIQSQLSSDYDHSLFLNEQLQQQLPSKMTTTTQQQYYQQQQHQHQQHAQHLLHHQRHDLSRHQLRQRLLAHKRRLLAHRDASLQQDDVSINPRGMKADTNRYAMHQPTYWDSDDGERSFATTEYDDLIETNRMTGTMGRAELYHPSIPFHESKKIRRQSFQPQGSGRILDSATSSVAHPPILPSSASARRMTIPQDNIQRQHMNPIDTSAYYESKASSASTAVARPHSRSSVVRMYDDKLGSTRSVGDDTADDNDNPATISPHERSYASRPRQLLTRGSIDNFQRNDMRLPLYSSSINDAQQVENIRSNTARSASSSLSASYSNIHTSARTGLDSMATTGNYNDIQQRARLGAPTGLQQDVNQTRTPPRSDEPDVTDMADQTFDYARAALGLPTVPGLLEQQQRVSDNRHLRTDVIRPRKGSLNIFDQKYKAYPTPAVAGGRRHSTGMLQPQSDDINDLIFSPERYVASGISSPALSPGYRTMFEDPMTQQQQQQQHLEGQSSNSPDTDLNPNTLFSPPRTIGGGGAQESIAYFEATSPFWSMFKDDIQQQQQQQQQQRRPQQPETPSTRRVGDPPLPPPLKRKSMDK